MDLSDIFEFPSVITTACNKDIPSLEEILKLWNINNNLWKIFHEDGIMNNETNHDILLINCDKLGDQEHVYKQRQNCANKNIHMNSFTLCLKDILVTTGKQYQYGMLIHCEIMYIQEH